MTPRWKGSVGAQYAINAGGVGKLTPRVDVTYQSIVFNDPQNQMISAQPGYALVNAALTWQATNGLWETTLRGTNLTNKVYYPVIGNGLSTYNDVVGTPGRPREFLVTLRRNF